MEPGGQRSPGVQRPQVRLWLRVRVWVRLGLGLGLVSRRRVGKSFIFMSVWLMYSESRPAVVRFPVRRVNQQVSLCGNRLSAGHHRGQSIQNRSEPFRTIQNHSEPFKTIQNYSELLRITLSPVTKAVRSNGVEVSRYIKWTYASKVP